jgi:hypothetical protein
MDSSNPLIQHISLEKLKRLIREEKNKHVFQRLLFIHQLYLEDGVEKACKRMCVSKQTGYNWLNNGMRKDIKASTQILAVADPQS